MNLLEFILAIIVISGIVKIVTARYQSHAISPPPVAGPDTAWMQEEVRQLRERVQVLERVITDSHPSADLDRQIERLRDR